MFLQNCEIPSSFLENMNIDEWESESCLSVWSINTFARDLFQCLVIIFICRTDVSRKCHLLLWKFFIATKTFLGGNQTFYQLQNAIKPSIIIHFFELKFKKTYLELPKLFYIKSKVNVRPIEILHFKLGFPNWYLRGFKISFSVIIQLSN